MPSGSNRRHDAKRANKGQPSPPAGTVALYHMVYRDEGFEEAATALSEITREAERTHPGQRRVLYLDIEDHRNPQGGYDHDMFELQRDFILGLLMPFLAEAHLPLGGHVINSKPQRGDLPDRLVIKPADSE
jgi:hypothetical protein